MTTLLGSLTYITLLSLISINVPGVGKELNSGLLNLAQLNSVSSDKIIADSFLNFNDSADEALNIDFQRFGYKKTNFLRNIQTAGTYVIIAIVTLMITLIANELALTQGK
jgi:hypothetical protein